MTALGAGQASATDFEQYSYDSNGNRTALRLRDSQVINYQYDALNREIVRDIPGGTAADVYSIYDAAGRRLSARFASTGGQGIIYSYDTAGRLATEASFGRQMSFQYDLASNRTRVTWPDNVFAQYTYDALNRVDQIGENGAFVGSSLLADYAYDPLSRRMSLTRGNGSTAGFAYDNASRLTGLTQDLSGTTNDQTLGFSYTAASQISQRTAANDNYNWHTQDVSRAYTRNGLNQYTNVGGAAFNYDSRGNLISDGSRNFAYDVENRLTQVSGAASLALSYDPLGRLRETTADASVTQFLYDGDRLVAEYDGAGALLRRTVHGPGVDEPLTWYEGSGLTDRRWLVADHQGSIIASNDNAGATTIQPYGPYGEPQVWTGSRFRYTGQIALPEVALYHYKARVYDPVLGRFLQTDPVGYQDDLNLYMYARNDPLNLIDPNGERVLEVTRPVRFLGIRLGVHRFTLVDPDKGGPSRRFSFGPERGNPGTAFSAVGDSGRLVAHPGVDTPTGRDDARAAQGVLSGQPGRGVSAREIDVTDDAAIAAGEAVEQGLANTSVPYNVVPDGFDVAAGRGFNSNTATQLVIDLAGEQSGTDPGTPTDNAYSPGTEYSDELRRTILPR